MIQRIQSIYLLLTGGAFGSFFAFPFLTTEESHAGFFADKHFDIQDHYGLMVLVVIGLLASLTAILLYKKRKMQLFLSYFSMVVAVILIPATALMLIYDDLIQPGDKSIDMSFGAIVPIVILTLSFLAIRNIKKDARIVRSMDRLR